MAPFGQQVGPTMLLPQTAVGIFRLFFTTSLLQLIVSETNDYAAQVIGDDVVVKWTDVNDNDIWAFLGFTLLMATPVTYVLELAVPFPSHCRADSQTQIPGYMAVPPLHLPHIPTCTTIINDYERIIITINCTRVIFLINQALHIPQTAYIRSGPSYRPLLLLAVRITGVIGEHAIHEAMVAFKGRSSMK